MTLNLQEQKKIEGVIAHLGRELEKLAPCPGYANGSAYKIGQASAIKGKFNKRVLWARLMEAYLKDLPKRVKLERFMSEHKNRIYSLQKYFPAPVAA